MADAIKHLHIIKKDISTMPEALKFASDTIREERLCEFSLNITEVVGSTGLRSWYEVQVEGRVGNVPKWPGDHLP